jgi:hypothetical protein
MVRLAYKERTQAQWLEYFTEHSPGANLIDKNDPEAVAAFKADMEHIVSDEHEFFAELFAHYTATREVPSPGLKTLFDKVIAHMKRVWNQLKGGAELGSPEDIIASYINPLIDDVYKGETMGIFDLKPGGGPGRPEALQRMGFFERLKATKNLSDVPTEDKLVAYLKSGRKEFLTTDVEKFVHRLIPDKLSLETKLEGSSRFVENGYQYTDFNSLEEYYRVYREDAVREGLTGPEIDLEFSQHLKKKADLLERGSGDRGKLEFPMKSAKDEDAVYDAIGEASFSRLQVLLRDMGIENFNSNRPFDHIQKMLEDFPEDKLSVNDIKDILRVAFGDSLPKMSGREQKRLDKLVDEAAEAAGKALRKPPPEAL